MFKIRTREDVLVWMDLATRQGHTYMHSTWMKDLWSLDRDAINHFLITRMCTTQDKDEYYGLLPYLKGFLTPEVITLFDHRFTLEELLNELEYLENKGIGKTSQPLSVMRNSDKSYVLTPNGLVLRNQPKTKTAIKRHL